MSAVVIYRTGLVMSSVCAPAAMDIEAVLADVNVRNHPGIGVGWQLSDAPWNGPADHPSTGKVGPIPCDTDPTRRHWLLEC